MAELELREIKEDEYPAWDKFVENSNQGTLFSTSSWMQVLNAYPDGNAKLLGVFSPSELVSGILLYERKKAFLKIMAYPPLTPFTSLLFKEGITSRLSKIESLHKKIIQLIGKYLSKNYNYAALQLDSSIKDIRPFLWLGWETSVNYTYEIDLSNIDDLWKKIDKDAKYEIEKARTNGLEVNESQDIGKFLILYEKTFLKHGSKTPLNRNFIREMFRTLKNKNKCKLYFACTREKEMLSGAFVVWDSKRAYYLMAASDPDIKLGSNYILLWHIIDDMSDKFKSLDLVGANIPNIIKFKREFATKLVHYFIVEKYSSFFVKLLNLLYRKIY